MFDSTSMALDRVIHNLRVRALRSAVPPRPPPVHHRSRKEKREKRTAKDNLGKQETLY